MTVENVETVETVETAETLETEETVLTEDLKKYHSLTHSLTDCQIGNAPNLAGKKSKSMLQMFSMHI